MRRLEITEYDKRLAGNGILISDWVPPSARGSVRRQSAQRGEYSA
jgi:hypothetical protein